MLTYCIEYNNQYYVITADSAVNAGVKICKKLEIEDESVAEKMTVIYFHESDIPFNANIFKFLFPC